jgi:hypothetical protein
MKTNTKLSEEFQAPVEKTYSESRILHVIIKIFLGGHAPKPP